MQEIMTNGPVEAAFSVYADFEACPYSQKLGPGFAILPLRARRRTHFRPALSI